MRRKICTIIGARPQFIKAAVLSRILVNSEVLQEVIVHTGQHYDANMSDIFFQELNIPEPDYNLGVGGGSHGQNTGRMLETIEGVLLKEKPDLLLVYGDTDSTLAGALAAAKIHIPVAHIEGGLRSFNRSMPEEINRVLTDHVSELLFVPTIRAVNNLKNEGISGDNVFFVGDVMYDAMLFYGQKKDSDRIYNRMNICPGQYVLATFHRAENTSDAKSLSDILAGLACSPYPVVLPLHPRTKRAIDSFGITLPENIKLIEPVGYLDMLALEKGAAMIATDSGGVQKEAYFCGVPCITMREETEWQELVSAGANILTGADTNKIAAALNRSIPKDCFSEALYGDGHAGEKIVDHIQDFLSA